MNNKNKIDFHIKMITSIIDYHFKQTPKSIHRISIGICNEVYNVRLENKETIVRLNNEDKFLMGSHDHIPKLKELGINVPDILIEDFSKKIIPFSYQIQNKIEGQDLDFVIESMTEEQLIELAKDIASIFKKVATIPASNQFGVVWGGGNNELNDSWTERMKIWINESYERGTKTGVMDDEILNIAKKLFTKYKIYFDSIKPITYFGDICSKNVMILNGKFNGLVDLDGLTQGDPLEAIGRIKLSWYGTYHGKIYADALMNELHLDKNQRKLVTAYALLNQISWACENGIQFNQNTKAEVNIERMEKDKQLIKLLTKELGLF
ncbi:hypothetical protein AYO45_04735 [Gammaproteobacteria bacterium SCGC AG-212-F23]|nr:hypothetical protein AYO45_04735 [Gammaproteobacteria bacterium SCGC AG-212-F23]